MKTTANRPKVLALILRHQAGVIRDTYDAEQHAYALARIIDVADELDAVSAEEHAQEPATITQGSDSLPHTGSPA